MKHIPTQLLVWLLAVLMVWPWPLRLNAQSNGTTFKPEELEQLVAPIALYPDSLVSQILMASTYPLEVVQADRWAKANKTLKGEALTKALEAQSWDPSVKSLVNFPQVLAAMSEKLDVTLKLGDAFLAQQKDVLNAIQRLRARAQAQGNLKTTKEQTVIVEPPATPTTVVEQPAAQQTTVIRIEPTDPQVVYVPTYNPTVVYGAWPYPAYPPYSYPYYPYGGYVATAAFAFTAGVALSAAWGYAWGGCNWHGGDVDIDVNRNTNFNRNINREQYRANMEARGQSGRGSWQHDASHRRGVSYRDQGTAQRFNRGTNAQAAQAREAFRGRAESGRQELGRGGVGDRGGIGDRGGVGNRGDVGNRGGVGDRGGIGDRGGVGDRGGIGGQAGGVGGTSRGREAGAFQGVGRGSEVRSASERGAMSRGGDFGGGGGRSGGFSSGGGGYGGGGGGGGGGFGGGRGGGGRR